MIPIKYGRSTGNMQYHHNYGIVKEEPVLKKWWQFWK